MASKTEVAHQRKQESKELFEEEWPSKYSSPPDGNYQKRRQFNKNSKKFGKELKATFASPQEVPFDLEQIYFGNNALTSWNKHPLALSYLTSSDTGKSIDITPTPLDPCDELEPTENRLRQCKKVTMQTLDEVQHVTARRNEAPFFIWHHQYGISLRPLTKSVHLPFNGIRKFVTSLDKLIETHFGEEDVTSLFVDDTSTPHSGTAALTKSKVSVGDKDLHEVWRSRRWISDPGPTYFDQRNHSFVLVPKMSKCGGFTSFNMKERHNFPLQFDFCVDGHSLSHKFKLPLEFQHQPQRLVLNFVFDLANNAQISIFSFVMIYSVIPVSPIPTTLASISLLEKIDTGRKLDPEVSQVETERLLKMVLLNRTNDRYFSSGKRLRYNSVPVETIQQNGFAIGFNFIYEIQPKPNTEWRIDSHRSRHRTRREIRSNINCDLKDYRNNHN